MSETFNPQELLYDTKECEVSEMCLDCVVATMRNSKYGKMLANNPPRYDYFHWEDLEAFKTALGPDVDPFKHGPYQAEFVGLPMILAQNASTGYQKFTKEEGKMLILGHALHDIHESIVGDVAKPDKTEESDIAELEVNLSVVSSILQQPLDSEFMTSYRGVVGDLKGWSFAGRAFTAGEWSGYFMTGMKAWAMRHHNELDQDQQALSERMGREVCSYALPHVVEYATEFIFCSELITKSLYALEEMT